MKKTIFRCKLAEFILTLVEISGVAAAALFYWQNWFGAKEAMEKLGVLPWLIIVGCVVLLNLIFNIVMTRKITKLRQQSDLKAADILGSDIQEAYSFGQIGLIIVDDNNEVIWVNTLLKERSFDVLGKNIQEWNPKFANFKGDHPDLTVQIEVNGHIYQVKYLAEASLYLLKDVTDFVNLDKYQKQTSTCLGLVVIDNYSDLAGNNEEENNDVIASARQVITDYAKNMDFVLRRFRSDSYFAVCDFQTLEKMEADNFSVLEKVKAASAGMNATPTLSIGFSHNFQGPTKLAEMAAQAVSYAMSRGGDQAVVSEFNKELAVFGGRSLGVESQSKVKIRSSADGFLALVSQTDDIMVMGHAFADMDALGGCLGVYAICSYLGKNCKIIYDPKNTESKTRQAFQSAFSKERLDQLTITRHEALSAIKESTLLVVVDVSVPKNTHAPEVLEQATKVAVIDHHRLGPSFIETNVFQYIEPSASSTSEILTEFIRLATVNPKIPLEPSFATIMLSGIFLDTNFFKSKSTGARTFDAAEILKTYGADNAQADDYLKDEYEEYSLTNRIISTMKIVTSGVVYCKGDDRDIVEDAALAKVGNQLMQLKGIHAAFVIGRVRADAIKISCRSDSTLNVQLIAEKLGGGGHYNASAVLFPGINVEEAEARLLEALSLYLNKA